MEACFHGTEATLEKTLPRLKQERPEADAAR